MRRTHDLHPLLIPFGLILSEAASHLQEAAGTSWSRTCSHPQQSQGSWHYWHDSHPRSRSFIATAVTAGIIIGCWNGRFFGGNAKHNGSFSEQPTCQKKHFLDNKFAPCFSDVLQLLKHTPPPQHQHVNWWKETYSQLDKVIMKRLFCMFTIKRAGVCASQWLVHIQSPARCLPSYAHHPQTQERPAIHSSPVSVTLFRLFSGSLNRFQMSANSSTALQQQRHYITIIFTMFVTASSREGTVPHTVVLVSTCHCWVLS